MPGPEAAGRGDQPRIGSMCASEDPEPDGLARGGAPEVAPRGRRALALGRSLRSAYGAGGGVGVIGAGVGSIGAAPGAAAASPAAKMSSTITPQ
jgi:hypothetical protein